MSKLISTRNLLSEYVGELEAIIVGSDQVWNTNWFTPEYFLDFPIQRPLRKVSYAACFGSSKQVGKLDDSIAVSLREFHFLSVRNQFSRNRVYNLCGRYPFVACDPTMLEDVFSLAREAEIQESRYILLYAMSAARMRRAAECANRLRKSYGVPVLAIKSCALQPWDMPENFKIIQDPSVEHWAWLIGNAAHIVTDSFHGTVLAMQRARNVTNYAGNNPSSIRTDDIFKRYGLQNNGEVVQVFQDSMDSGDLSLAIRSEMSSHSEESRKFLMDALG